MIKEFALDPEAIATSFLDFKYIIEKFGVPKGRVISRFPKNWKRMVYEAAQTKLKGTTELSRIEVRLQNISDDVLFPSGRPGGDSSKVWIDRALEEHSREKFTAIISNDVTHPDVLHKDEIEDKNPHFSPNYQWTIPRTSQAIADCADFLLRHGKIVKLVDPHFDIAIRRFRRPFNQILSRLKGQEVLIEVHRADNKSDAFLLNIFNQTLPAALPQGVTLKLYIHPILPMHNRYLMTESGGLIYGVGLDDNEDGGGASNDQVTLLASDVFKDCWSEYSNARQIGEWTR